MSRRARPDDDDVDDEENVFEPAYKRAAFLIEKIKNLFVKAAALINTAAEEDKPVSEGSIEEIENQFEEAERIRMKINKEELEQKAKEKTKRYLQYEMFRRPDIENHKNTLARILIFLQEKRAECEKLTSRYKRQKYLPLFDRLIARVQEAIKNPLFIGPRVYDKYESPIVKRTLPPSTRNNTAFTFQGRDYHELRHMVPKPPKTMLERRINRNNVRIPHDLVSGDETSYDVAQIVQQLAMGGPLDYRIPIKNTPATEQLREEESDYGELVTERDLKNIRDEAERNSWLDTEVEKDSVRYRQALDFKQRRGKTRNRDYEYDLNSSEVAERFLNILNKKLTEFGATDILFLMFGDIDLERFLRIAKISEGLKDRYVFYAEIDPDPDGDSLHAITIVIEGLSHLQENIVGAHLKPSIIVLDSSGFAYSIESFLQALRRNLNVKFNKQNAIFLRNHQDMFHWEFPRNVIHQFSEIYDGDCVFFSLWYCLWLALNPSIPTPLPPPPPYQNMEMFRRYIMLCLKENTIVDSEVIRKFTGGKKIRKL